ncbi:butyrophilin-like protein 2 isoform X4 [Acanthopagrus latus]|uniref:butyrophilin-like protein 2 isoform X4 n=1 Tax=Acanthopagrus latus TaxID=8177 RepID=UPI00187C2999|nr:butyrophilin-like protein 2 isoform X4 [Acanthopagrus latus]
MSALKSASWLFCLCCYLLALTEGTVGQEQGPGVKVVVKEDSDAVLPCLISTKENIIRELFDWKKDGQKKKEVFLYDAGIHYNNGRQGQDEQFRGRVSHFQDQLEYGNASIKIQNVKVTDSGIYSCDFPRLQPSQTFYTELVVERLLKDRSGETTGASKPFTTILDATKGRFLLQCEVGGASPEPTVEWKDSAGNILPAEEPQVSESGGRYDVTIKTSVTKTGRYRCEVTQEEISHQTFAETVVFISEKLCEDQTTRVAVGWLFGGFILGAAVFAAVLVGLKATKRITLSCNRGPGVKVVVKEGSDALLPCLISTKENIIRGIFDWKKDGQKKKEVFLYDAGIHYNNGRQGQDEQFRGRVSHFQDQLMSGNASIKIQNVKVTDSGNYSCDFPRLQPSQIFYIELVVGASKPCITRLNETNDWALLQCEVRGASPEPKVEWKDSAGNILRAEEPQVSERGGLYDVTINITVTETGRYRCEVTQEEISHQTSAETFVYISEKLGKDPSIKVHIGWLAVAFVIGVAVHAAAPFGLRATKRIRVCFNQGAAREPTTTSADITNDIPLLQDGVKGENENGLSKAPPEILNV